MFYQGIIGKVIVSAVVLSSVLGTTAYAADDSQSIKNIVREEAQTYSSQYSISVNDALVAVQNSIANVETLKKNGSVSKEDLVSLANEILNLQTAYLRNGSKDRQAIYDVLDKAISTVDGLNNADIVLAVVDYVKSTLDTTYVETVEMPQYTSSNSTLTFSDVEKGSWYYDAVMAMTAKGILSGTTTPVNGVGTFNPNGIMTRAEFITVVTRMFYNDDLKAMKSMEGAVWYTNYYMVAVNNGLITENEMDFQDMNNGCTRQEMAMIMVRALKDNGETANRLVSTSKIADWNSIGTYYRNYVREAYSMGLLAGVNTKGTFNPQGTLTRAEAATVAYRMIEKSTRSTPNFDVVESTIVNGHQEFVEGSRHNQCKEGDVVIKADGTRVVLEKRWGILGAGQGVDIWTGVVTPAGVELHVGSNCSDGSPILMDSRGETHTGMEWDTLREQAHPSREGHKTGYDGEVYNIWFTYYDGFGWSYGGPRR